jgi:hypothetical protein
MTEDTSNGGDVDAAPEPEPEPQGIDYQGDQEEITDAKADAAQADRERLAEESA